MLYDPVGIVNAVRHFCDRMDAGKLHPADEPAECVALIIASEGSLHPQTLDSEFLAARWDYRVAALLTDDAVDQALQIVDAAIADHLPELIGADQ